MGVRRCIAIAAGVTISSLGIPLASAAAAYALPPSIVCGVITGPHTFILCPGETVVVGELLRPDTPGYTTSVPVVAVSVSSTGVVTVTTGSTFLPLDTDDATVTFTVEAPPVVSPPPPPISPPLPPPHPPW